MAENSLLISECNHLRKEGRKLRMQLDQASQQIHIERQKIKRLAMEQKHAAASTSTTTMQEIEAVAEPAAEPNGAVILNTGRGPLALPTPKGGQIIRGSTRALNEVSSTRSKVGGMLSQLDDNNREIEVQRIEIRRLREQVFLLMNQLQQGGAGGGGGGGDGVKLEALNATLPTGNADAGQDLANMSVQGGAALAGSV